MIKFTRQLLLLSLLGGLVSQVSAQQIVGVKTTKLEVFAKPEDDKPLSIIEPVGLPWQIKEERNAYFKVRLNGKDVWIDGMQVTVLRDSADKCPPKPQSNGATPEVVAASPGAGAMRCR